VGRPAVVTRPGGETLHQINHNSYFLRSRGRKVGSSLLTLVDDAIADRSWSLTDDQIVESQRAELKRMFPSASAALDSAQTRVHRWPRVIPPFRKGWLGHQAALRAPHGAGSFCGDYTAQPERPAPSEADITPRMAVTKLLESRLQAAS